MTRLSTLQLKMVKEMINQNKSLNVISNKLGLGKTTIYYYMRKIKGRKYIPIKLNLRSKECIGEIIGIFSGDGHYVNDKKRWDRRIRIYFNINEPKLVEYYKNSIKILINKNPTVLIGNSVKILQITSKSFCDFILSYVTFGSRKVLTIQLQNKNLLKNKPFVKGFLRGLTDSDGYVRKGRKEIYYGSISKNLFNDFLEGLNLFGFKYKTYVQKRAGCSDFYKVRLSKEEVDKFNSMIKPLKRL